MIPRNTYKLGQTAFCSAILRTQRASLSSAHSFGFRGSHLAGIAGGAAGTDAGKKAKVDAAQKVSTYFGEATRFLSAQIATQRAQKFLGSLRQFTKIYASVIPGAGFLVDVAFDSVDQVVHKHGEEAARIAKEAFADIRAVSSKRRSGENDIQIALRVMEVIHAKLGQLLALGIRAGATHFNELALKYPHLSAALGNGYFEFGALAKKGPLQMQKIYEDAKGQVITLLSNAPTGYLTQKTQDIISFYLSATFLLDFLTSPGSGLGYTDN